MENSNNNSSFSEEEDYPMEVDMMDDYTTEDNTTEDNTTEDNTTEDDTTEDNTMEDDIMRDVRSGTVREVGDQAVWSVSSCKPGYGVDKLRNDCLETYWQSDGELPHLVNIQFRRKTFIRDICIYIDHELDESYTPGRISVRTGTNFNDLQEVEVVNLSKPRGWIKILIKGSNDLPLKTYMLQIAVVSNLENGKDTHMRQIKIHSPIEKKDTIDNFSTVEMRQYTTIR